MPTFVEMTGPGTATVTDDTAIAVETKLTPAVTAGFLNVEKALGNSKLPGSIVYTLNEINLNIARIADQSKGISSAVGNLNSAIGSMTSAMTTNNLTQAALAANQISTNNFQVQVTKESLKRAGIPEPTMPSPKEQFTESLKQALEFSSISRASGAVTQFINSTVEDTAKWIAGTEIYRSIENYLKQAKDAILAVEVSSGTTLGSLLRTGRSS